MRVEVTDAVKFVDRIRPQVHATAATCLLWTFLGAELTRMVARGAHTLECRYLAALGKKSGSSWGGGLQSESDDIDSPEEKRADDEVREELSLVWHQVLRVRDRRRQRC
ncbi:hypothetical protein CEXT_474631 [Caerostris extrusa]|uniref:Uncharacterized protein n=1 Tax=Caerostris extrusa TaxID=172846 RepID=A0AAV4VZX7_CAEEX|nr:hypothetical protein CEXT_474631 [Caerostris extrusa]